MLAFWRPFYLLLNLVSRKRESERNTIININDNDININSNSNDINSNKNSNRNNQHMEHQQEGREKLQASRRFSPCLQPRTGRTCGGQPLSRCPQTMIRRSPWTHVWERCFEPRRSESWATPGGKPLERCVVRGCDVEDRRRRGAWV